MCSFDSIVSHVTNPDLMALMLISTLYDPWHTLFSMVNLHLPLLLIQLDSMTHRLISITIEREGERESEQLGIPKRSANNKGMCLFV